MNTENWKRLDFIGFPKYAVSDQGRVKRLGGKILKQQNTRHGYLQVSLYMNDKKVKHCRVNRLVALAFLQNERIGQNYEVHHKNFNKKDNRISNLIWLSHQENCRENTHGIPVWQYSLDGELVKSYENIKQASLCVRCSPPTIARHCRNNKPYKGFIWRF